MSEVPTLERPRVARPGAAHVGLIDGFRRQLPPGVTFRDAGDLPNAAVRDFLLKRGLAAWTNSATEVFVNASLAERAAAEAALHHEAVHIQQFLANGGPPPSYSHMISYECTAYRQSAAWTSAHSDPDVRFFARGMQQHADRLCGEIDAAKKAHLTRKALDRRYQLFLIKNKYLPGRQFKDPLDLYRLYPPPRP